MSRKVENERIKEISEGNFHSIHASNKAEKFKLRKLSQGIESCRQAQFLKYRKEEKKLLKTLDRFDKEKSKHISEDEQFFQTYSPGDGITMLSYSDLLTRDEEKGDGSEKGSNDSDQDDACKKEEVIDGKITDGKEAETIECWELESEPDRKIMELQEEIRRQSLGDKPGNSRRGSLNQGKQSSNSGYNLSAAGSCQTIGPRKRLSLDSQSDVIPFYMQKKYDHHAPLARLAERRSRLLRRRGALTLEDERYLLEWQMRGPSADLGTISFKSSCVDRSWLNADVRKEREVAIKRQPESNMEMAHKHRPGSGFSRINMALERMPSENSLLQNSLSSSKAVKAKVQGTDSVESTSRRQSVSMTLNSSVVSMKNGLESKLPLLSQRRHTIGEVLALSASIRRANLDNLKSFKSLRRIDCTSDVVSFEDKGTVFPAYEKDRPYSLKEFISLRKCRYLRLSKLNWESLLWQSKHQALLNF